MNQTEKLVKVYEKVYKKNGYDASLEEYERGLIKSNCILLKHNPTLEKQYEFWLTKLGKNCPVKIYAALKNNDMELLNNYLFEIAQLREIGNILSSGFDHTYYAYNILPELLISCRFDRIKLILPKEDGMSKYNYCGSVIINLFMAIWYKDEEFLSIAKAMAEKKLNQKLNALEKAYIEFLLALSEKDTKKISYELLEICKGSAKSKDYGESEFTHRFSIIGHAMYNLSLYVYDGELADKIEMPKYDNFLIALAQYQKSNKLKPGKIITVYNEPLNILNKILNCYPPTMTLIKIDNKFYLNTSKYKNEVIQELLKN
jgi:hypothetical protein